MYHAIDALIIVPSSAGELSVITDGALIDLIKINTTFVKHVFVFNIYGCGERCPMIILYFFKAAINYSMVSLAKLVLPWTFKSSVHHCYIYVFPHARKCLISKFSSPLSNKNFFGTSILILSIFELCN